jgi:tetratricopeptide (TPR) repeat protein
MYTEACEATHVRGEQSGEVLDLRMTCLATNLDEVRAFGEVLAGADGEALGRAVTGVQDLTPVTRCADVALLRSTVPLPRDERTLKTVGALRRSLMEVRALNELGNFVPARQRAKALRPQVEATGYKPLLAEVLELIGHAESQVDTTQAEHTLEDSFLVAEESRDDATAALATTTLIYVVGYGLDRPEGGKRWARISNAILNRLGPGHARTRSWMLNNLAAIYVGAGDFEQARPLFEQAIAIKEETLGKEHPDVAAGLSNLAQCYLELGLTRQAVEAAGKAIAILSTHGDPDTPFIADSYDVRGTTFCSVGRYREAAQDFQEALAILHRSGESSPTHPETGSALHGLGEVKLAQADPAGAARLFEEALSLREKAELDVTIVADTRFGLARALWDSGGDRTRARSLATQARTIFAAHDRTKREQVVTAWLEAHKHVNR